MIDGELAGHDCRAAAVAIVDDFEQVATLLGGQRCQPPIVEDQKFDTGEALEEPYTPSIAACQRKRVEARSNRPASVCLGQPGDNVQTVGSPRPSASEARRVCRPVNSL
jgi:hypothetical protein